MAEDRRRFVSNIVNVGRIDGLVAAYRARLRDADLRRWWARNLRRHLSRDPSLLAEIDGLEDLARLCADGTLPLPVPRWAVADLSVGRAVHRFVPERLDPGAAGKHQPVTGPALDAVADWMATLDPHSRHRRRLHRISVPEAIRLAGDWARGRRRKDEPAPEEAPGDISPVITFDDGFRVVELVTPAAFERESRLLRNCLHDTERFRASAVYSLRDATNRPHVAIEFQGRLLVQVKGFANSTPRPKYHAYLMRFLRLMRVPNSEINLRLGLIEMNGAVYPGVDACVAGFARWAGALEQPDELPFMRDPMIRDFVNVYTRFGRRAGPAARRTVLSLFRPRGRAWRNHPGTEIPLPGGIQLWHPRLPAALMHMARYDALPEADVLAIYGAALSQIIERAEADPANLYDITAENRLLSEDGLGHLLDAVGLRDRYEAARARSRTIKLAAIQNSTRGLARQLRRRDLSDARRARICRVVQDVYPRLKGRLLSEDGIL